ncbi:hypothetical protein BSLG_006500 [Batrachochytrium salamandrivorans]|nr:hypothetical protein BASA62_001397 [Batrachochytrium salamandrivorans]KAJ1338863.1 hypothetical protein BSLG_006500 [Batrachochytrium salamandrivorans]
MAYDELAKSSGTTTPILTLSIEKAPVVPEGFPLNGLSEEQLALVNRLCLEVPKLLEVSGTPEQLAKETQWANTACVVRYLKATKWNYDHAVTRLSATLQWRREYKPDEILAEEVAPEAETGKEVICGFDKQGQPVLYLIPARENTKNYDRQLRFVVYNLEKAISLMPNGVEGICMIVDYENISMSSAPPLSVTRRFLQTIGDHYPERLGKSFIINPTWYLSVLFRIIGPFMDPVTKSKIHMVDLKALMANPDSDKNSNDSKKPAAEGAGGWADVRNYISKDNLLVEYGGGYKFEWDFSQYWSALTAAGQAKQ